MKAIMNLKLKLHGTWWARVLRDKRSISHWWRRYRERLYAAFSGSSGSHRVGAYPYDRWARSVLLCSTASMLFHRFYICIRSFAATHVGTCSLPCMLRFFFFWNTWAFVFSCHSPSSSVAWTDLQCTCIACHALLNEATRWVLIP
jgi:hypothetical protein